MYIQNSPKFDISIYGKSKLSVKIRNNRKITEKNNKNVFLNEKLKF